MGMLWMLWNEKPEQGLGAEILGDASMSRRARRGDHVCRTSCPGRHCDSAAL